MGKRDPIPTYFFAVIVVRRGDRFLLVHETKHGQHWYLPAGRVELGETLEAAARRETLEETGVVVALDGILRIEHSPMPWGARVRVIYLAHAPGAGEPKQVADEHSLEAAWVSLADLDTLSLRGEEVKHLLAEVAGGAPVYPLSLIAPEGTPLIAGS